MLQHPRTEHFPSVYSSSRETVSFEDSTHTARTNILASFPTKWRLLCLLLQSHQASQQTNFGRVQTSQFPEPGSFEKFWMYITAFATISSNRNLGSFDSEEDFYHKSGIDVEEKILFRVESHVFTGEEFENK